jgi:hypothetical protein
VKRTLLISILTLSIAIAASSQDSQAPTYTATGELRLPADYREWVFLSAGLGMTYSPLTGATADNPPFQNVFVTRPAYQAYIKTGRWPAKTMFILEIRTSESNGSINKGGHYQTNIAAIEAEVKEGDQWVFYGFGKDGTTGKPFPRTERCYSCHAENAASDNTFVQFYPTLLPIAKAKGTFKATPETK